MVSNNTTRRTEYRGDATCERVPSFKRRMEEANKSTRGHVAGALCANEALLPQMQSLTTGLERPLAIQSLPHRLRLLKHPHMLMPTVQHLHMCAVRVGTDRCTNGERLYPVAQAPALEFHYGGCGASLAVQLLSESMQRAQCSACLVAHQRLGNVTHVLDVTDVAAPGNERAAQLATTHNSNDCTQTLCARPTNTMFVSS